MQVNVFFFKFYLFFERERGSECTSRRGAERGGQRIQSGLYADSLKLIAASPMGGSNPQTARLQPELKSDVQPTEPPKCPS